MHEISIDGEGGVWLRLHERGRRFKQPDWLGRIVAGRRRRRRLAAEIQAIRCTANGALTGEQKAAVRRVAALVRQDDRRHSEELPDGSEAYAYPHGRSIAWGVNSAVTGFCVARGVCGRGPKP